MKKKNQNIGSVKFKNFLKNNSLLLVFLVFIGVIVLIVLLANSNGNEELVYGDDVIDMYYFHLSTCPHCHKQNEFMDRVIEKQYPNVRINRYEITAPESKQKYIEFASKHPELDPNSISTPTTIIGNRTNVGYGTDETSGQIIIDMIEEEQRKIDAKWNPSTMITTEQLRAK